MAQREEQQRGTRPPPPWAGTVLELLRDWGARAAQSADAHYDLASRLSRANVRFGVPVVVLTTFVGTSVFATLGETDVNLALRVGVGMISVLAAVLASLQTFLRFGERAEQHRAAAENWNAIRREIDQMLALHPRYDATRGDPQEALNDLRRRMNEVAQQSPEMGVQGVWRTERRYRPPSHEPGAAEARLVEQGVLSDARAEPS